MDKTEELELFLLRADELIESKYIVADIKIVNLLKAIASSDTLLAIFKNCLNDFDFESAKKKYLIKNEYLAEDKGEFVLPDSSRELLAFIFCVLVAIDAKEIDLAQFIKRYFYEDGSYATGYATFINAMIKPLKNTVKSIMDSVIGGKIQDPIDAINEEEKRKNIERQEKERQERLEKEASLKSYGESLNKLYKMLLEDKSKLKKSNKKQQDIDNMTLIIDMLANAMESSDKDAIIYAYLAYKYMVTAYKHFFRGRVKKTSKLIEDIINGI